HNATSRSAVERKTTRSPARSDHWIVNFRRMAHRSGRSTGRSSDPVWTEAIDLSLPERIWLRLGQDMRRHTVTVVGLSSAHRRGAARSHRPRRVADGADSDAPQLSKRQGRKIG